MRSLLTALPCMRGNCRFEDTMDPVLSLLIATNNYFHDIAIAMPMASGVMLWAILRELKDDSAGEVRFFILSIYRRMARAMTYLLLWITAGAIPRILTFRDYEWACANTGGNMPGLIAKHVALLLVLLAGVFLWISLPKKIRELEGRDKIV